MIKKESKLQWERIKELGDIEGEIEMELIPREFSGYARVLHAKTNEIIRRINGVCSFLRDLE